MKIQAFKELVIGMFTDLGNVDFTHNDYSNCIKIRVTFRGCLNKFKPTHDYRYNFIELLPKDEIVKSLNDFRNIVRKAKDSIIDDKTFKGHHVVDTLTKSKSTK